MLQTWIEQLIAGRPLDDDEVRQAVEQLSDESIPTALKADFLAALNNKGETPGEIAAFARALRGKAIVPPLDAEVRSREILDVVGTGGDHLGTFNISTATALGVRMDLPPEEAARSLRERNFAFFFAPAYHPAFKNIAPARKLCAERGGRTIFNLLGPLLNPARPSAMLMGVPRPELCEPLARVLQTLGVRRAMVVCGKVSRVGFLDELSTLGENTIAEFYQERGFAVSTLSPAEFPLQRAALADLLGGDKTVNAKIIRDIFSGAERGARREAVLFNAAAALFVAGKSRSLMDGWSLAGETIDRGLAQAKLAELAGG